MILQIETGIQGGAAADLSLCLKTVSEAVA